VHKRVEQFAGDQCLKYVTLAYCSNGLHLMFDHSALKRTINSDSKHANIVFERLTGHTCQHCFSLDRPFALGSESSLSLLFESRSLTSSDVRSITLRARNRVAHANAESFQLPRQDLDQSCMRMVKLVQAYIACPSAVEVYLSEHPQWKAPCLDTGTEVSALIVALLDVLG
jgi:hypothetical protein